MSASVSLIPRIRTLFWLHRREQSGGTGRLALPMFLIRVVLLVIISIRLWTLTESWTDLPDAEQWHQLWLLMGVSWLSFILMATLFTLQTTMVRQEVAIMLPLPLDDGGRWRLVLIRSASSFGILTIGSAAVTAGTLTRFGIDWTITYLLWLPASVCLGVLLPLFVAWLMNSGHPRRAAILITLAILAALVSMVVYLFQRQAGAPLSPIILVPDALISTGIITWFGARRLGHWYLALAQSLITAPRRTRDFLGPLSSALRSVLARHRSPWAAIVLKELRMQARDIFMLLRIALVLGALPLYIFTHEVLPDRLSDAASLPVAYALLLAVYSAIETTPSPFGAEGNRLTLVMLNGVSPHDLIAGKALAVTSPLIIQMWAMAAAIAVWSSPPVHSLASTILTATFAVAAIGTVLTCLSVRDIDLRQVVESSAQALLVEHVPASPIRLAIIGSTMMFAFGATALILTFPWWASTAVIIVAGPMLSSLAYRDAYRRLSHMTVS